MVFLPQSEFFPNLSPAEVARYTELGAQGRRLWRAGDLPGAEAAFRAQIEIFGPNPDPFVSLALLEAGRGATAPALERLRAAVLRGFNDFRRIERAESWTGMPRNTQWLDLEDAAVQMERIARDWPGWDDFRVPHVAEDVASVQQRHVELVARIDAMAPALGPRLTALWKRMIDRAAAAMLDAYIAKYPTAPDADQAFDSLLALYAGGPLRRWQRLPSAVAERLGAISRVVLERSSEDSTRPVALLGLALARNAERNGRGRLDAAAAQEVINLLREVVDRHPDSPQVEVALVGLVRTESEAGHGDHARADYQMFRQARAGDLEQLEQVQAELGELGLRLGGLPHFSVDTLDGGTIEPATLRGKVVVLDFWATWCRPCVEEFPVLRRIHERHADDVVLVGVDLDSTDEVSPEKLREWIAAENLPGVQVHDGRGWESELVQALGVREIPFTVVLGTDGEVLAVNQQGKRLEAAVRDALRPKTQ